MFIIKKIILKSIILLLCSTFTSLVNATINAEIFKTPKNIEIILLQDKTTDLVSLNFGFKGAGSIADEPTKAGLGSTMMNLTFRSNAAGMDRHAKARKVRELGILTGIKYEVDDDDIALAFKCPLENLRESLAMLNTMLFKAELDNTELNKIKNFGVGNSNLANASELNFAWATLRATIYQGHPYANTASGNQQGLQSLNMDDIKQAFSKRLAKDNLIVAVVGNIDKKIISDYIDTTFATLSDKSTLPTISPAIATLDGQTKTIFKDSPQSSVIFVQQSIPYTHKDFYPLLILNRILGGEPFTSRLWLEIREKQGLVYNISTSAHSELKSADIMTGWFKSDNENVAKVIAIIKEQWVKLKANGVTKEEFENAKTGTIGQYALNFVSPEQTSAYLLENRLLGFDIQHINERNNKVKAVTLEDVNRVAKEYLHPEQLSFVIIGNP
jgi:zinc protease